MKDSARGRPLVIYRWFPFLLSFPSVRLFLSLPIVSFLSVSVWFLHTRLPINTPKLPLRGTSESTINLFSQQFLHKYSNRLPSCAHAYVRQSVHKYQSVNGLKKPKSPRTKKKTRRRQTQTKSPAKKDTTGATAKKNEKTTNQKPRKPVFLFGCERYPVERNPPETSHTTRRRKYHPKSSSIPLSIRQ
jgi:hypothetical protein